MEPTAVSPLEQAQHRGQHEAGVAQWEVEGSRFDSHRQPGYTGVFGGGDPVENARGNLIAHGPSLVVRGLLEIGLQERVVHRDGRVRGHESTDSSIHIDMDTAQSWLVQGASVANTLF